MLKRRLLALLLGIVVMTAGTLAGLAVIEIGFRVYEFVRPSGAKAFFWVPSTEYGWGLAPGREGPYYDDRGEFHTHVRINSHGLRDGEHSYEKPAGVFRILVLGDSYMEALQVEEQQMFARLLEKNLDATPGRRIEVINTGVSAWGSDNELLFLRSEGYKYQPDLILLSFTTANDIRESYEPFNRMALGANLTKPHFTLAESGALEKHPPTFPPSPPVQWWREHLRVGQYLYNRLSGAVAIPGPNASVGVQPPTDPKIPYVPSDLLVYEPTPLPQVTEAYRVTKALIAALRDAATGMGAKFAVMVHNAPWAHYDDRWKFMCMRSPYAEKLWDRQKPNREIDAFLESEDIPFIDLYGTFDAAKSQEPLFFQFDPHWRPAGHQRAAAAAAEFLKERQLVP